MRASATTSHSSPHSLFFCHYPARSFPLFKLNKTNPYISYCFDRFYGLVLLYCRYVIFVKYVLKFYCTLSCELPEILQLNPAYIHSSAFRIKSMISSNERSLSTYASYNTYFALSIFRSGCRSSSSVESSSARYR